MKKIFLVCLCLIMIIGVSGCKSNKVVSEKGEGKKEEVHEPKSFSEDNWSTIISAVKSGNTSNYKVGDTKEIDMGDFGKHIIRIANMSTPSECSNEDFSQTTCGFVLEFADIITKHNMNSKETTVGGWEKSELRTYINNDIYNALPDSLKDAIIDTRVESGHGIMDKENFVTTDKLYLLSVEELSFDSTRNVSAIKTRKLDYYTTSGSDSADMSLNIKKYQDKASTWWLRGALFSYGFNDGLFTAVTEKGYGNASWSKKIVGVSPAFRIG